MPGPAPKPAHLRQRANRKAGATTLQLSIGQEVPDIPNPDGRPWHALTLESWAHAFASPMASQWLEADIDGLGRLAVLWDEFYKKPDAKVLGEIRLQGQLFGLTPLDRSRLQWEVNRAEGSERRKPTPQRRNSGDPRAALMAVK